MSLLLPESWPFSIDWLPPSACLVGGAVRDALLSRQSKYIDLDFIIPTEAIALGQKIARYYHAGFVILDEGRQIVRIIFPQGTVDLAQQEGDTLEADLARRDFTVNAIAYNPWQKSFLDPLGGLSDLEKKQLKMVSQANLESDPLRILRAYRQGAQLNFTIEENTHLALEKLATLLLKVAPERVKSELNLLLANPHGYLWIEQAFFDNVLNIWLPSVTATKIEYLSKINSFLPWLVNNWSNFPWESEIAPLARLACLVDDSPEQAEKQLMQLKYPKQIFQGIKSVLQSLTKLGEIQNNFTLGEQYFFFLNIKKYFPILAMLSLASNINLELITYLINCYNNPHNLVAHPQSLVTGNDLIKHLNLKPGIQIGYLLTEIQIAQIEGKISTATEALEFAQLQLSRDIELNLGKFKML